MLSSRTLAAVRPTGASLARSFARNASTAAHKFVVVGGGTAGVTVAAQLQRAFAAEGRPLNEGDIAIVEPAKTHHCELEEEPDLRKVA
jgi:NADH dehydrogenase FAD-containing subunit